VSIHSPETCLPGSSWEFKNAGKAVVPLSAPPGSEPAPEGFNPGGERANDYRQPIQGDVVALLHNTRSTRPEGQSAGRQSGRSRLLNPSLYIHTIRHLKPGQVSSRRLRRVNGRAVSLSAPAAVAARSLVDLPAKLEWLLPLNSL